MIRNMSFRTFLLVIYLIPAAFIIFIMYFGPVKGQITKEQQIRWNKKFHKLGLASVPRKAMFGSEDLDSDGWSFQTDNKSLQKWITDSKSIKTAEVITRPEKMGFIISDLPINKVYCIEITAEEDNSEVRITVFDTVLEDNSPDDFKYTKEEAIKICRKIIKKSKY